MRVSNPFILTRLVNSWVSIESLLRVIELVSDWVSKWLSYLYILFFVFISEFILVISLLSRNNNWVLRVSFCLWVFGWLDGWMFGWLCDWLCDWFIYSEVLSVESVADWYMKKFSFLILWKSKIWQQEKIKGMMKKISFLF